MSVPGESDARRMTLFDRAVQGLAFAAVLAVLATFLGPRPARGWTLGVAVVLAMAAFMLDRIHRTNVEVATHRAERENLKAEVRQRELHDPLTGLPNRRLLRDHLDLALRRAERAGTSVGLVVLDLDHFKRVNDVYGPSQGDDVLSLVAARIRAALRDTDTPARIGGDEFAVILEDLTGPDTLTMVADRVAASVRGAVPVERGVIHIDASYGAVMGALASGSSIDEQVDDLIRDAEIAVSVSKEDGRGQITVFRPEMRAASIRRFDLEEGLRLALIDQQFLLHYQPIVRLDSGQISGVEALLRWNHPQEGMISPGLFIPVAEESRQIVPIGTWVLREATRQAAEWHRRFPRADLLTVSVNVSPLQLTDGNLVGDVAAALDRSGLAPGALILEITESGLITEIERSRQALAALKALGVRLALDDFGTRASSLSHLHDFAFDILKIDRSFVGDDDPRPELANAIVDLGRTVHVQTIAEGIETREQLARFRELSCNYGQGNLFSRPARGAEIEALLAARSRSLSYYAPDHA